MRVNRDGGLVGGQFQVSNAGGDSGIRHQGLLWTGSEHGLVWSDTRDGQAEIYFARVATDGSPIGPELRVTNAAGDSGHAAMTWTGTGYSIFWADNRDGNYEIYFTRLSAEGVKVGDDVRITNVMGASIQPAVAWNGSNYGLVWSDDRDGGASELYFGRLVCEDGG